MLNAILHNLKIDIETLQEMIKNESKPIEIIKQFCNIVRIHINAIELSSK